jgi:hypothetical protein
MNSKSSGCSKASENLTKVIDVESRFPNYVFHELWCDFHLFDSDWIFEGAFVDKVLSMLDAEGSSCACLVNLDRDMDDALRVFVIDSSATAAAYQRLLRGSGSADGWIYAMDRFACISDKGTWCIYSERQNELAIIGFMQGTSGEMYRSVLEVLHAGRVADVLAGHADYEPSAHVVSREWRDEILKRYGAD